MLDIQSLSDKNKTILKILGVYQIVGGSLGLIILSNDIFHDAQVYKTTLIIGTIFFLFSIYAGWSTFKLKNKSFLLTLINQSAQSLIFVFAGFTYQYYSGLGLTFTLDMTDSLLIGGEINLSTFSFGLGDDRSFIGFNIVALYLIYLIEKIKADTKP